MLCPNCGKPTEEAFAALCSECNELKEQAKREAAEKLRAEQEKKNASLKQGKGAPKTSNIQIPNPEIQKISRAKFLLKICWGLLILLLVALAISFFVTPERPDSTEGQSDASATPKPTHIGEVEDNYSPEDVPQLGIYNLERYQKLTLKLKSLYPMKLSYSHPKNFDNSRCKEQCAKISVIGENAKITAEWIGLNRGGVAIPVDGNISVELQNLTDRSLDVVLHGEVLD